MKPFPEHIDPDLLIAYLNGELDAGTKALVTEWIDLSVENKARFESLRKVWDHCEALPQPADVDTEMAWRKLSERIDSLEQKEIQRSGLKIRRPVFYRIALRAAAVIVPLLITGYFMAAYLRTPDLLSLTTTGEVLNKKLPDGTDIRLNMLSKLEYPERFDEETREVKLSGEAFFNVVPNHQKPFIIHSGNVDVKVVGTSFNVKAYPDSEQIEVLVKTGKVVQYSIDNNGEKIDSIILEPGNKGIYNRTTTLLTKIDTADINDLYWTDKVLTFNKTRLGDVFAVIESKYNVDIVIKKKEIEDLRLTTGFTLLPVEQVMDIIAESFHLKITKTGSTFEVDVADK